MSILEISTAVFPTLTALLVWRYLQVNLHFNIQHHTKSGQYPYIQVPIEDLEVKDRPNEDWFSLVDAERERPFRTTNPRVSLCHCH
jgi:hypothetical protein